MALYQPEAKLITGTVTTSAASATALSAVDLLVYDMELRNIDPTNNIFVGSSNVANLRGTRIGPDTSVEFPTIIPQKRAMSGSHHTRFNLKDVYVIASAGTPILCWAAQA